MLTKQFEVSYAGEVRYRIGGERYSVRYSAPINFGWNGDYFETGIKPSIGTVRYDDSSKWHEFPPAEVVALFPGLVGLRLVYNRADNLPVTHPDHQIGTMEYIHNGPAPELMPARIHGWLTSKGSLIAERESTRESQKQHATGKPDLWESYEQEIREIDQHIAEHQQHQQDPFALAG